MIGCLFGRYPSPISQKYQRQNPLHTFGVARLTLQHAALINHLRILLQNDSMASAPLSQVLRHRCSILPFAETMLVTSKQHKNTNANFCFAAIS